MAINNLIDDGSYKTVFRGRILRAYQANDGSLSRIDAVADGIHKVSPIHGPITPSAIEAARQILSAELKRAGHDPSPVSSDADALCAALNFAPIRARYSVAC